MNPLTQRAANAIKASEYAYQPKPNKAFATPAGSPWTHDLDAEAVRLWNAGRSARQIANIFGRGITRNSVIGKLHRLKKRGVAMREASPNDAERQRKFKPKQTEPHAKGPKSAMMAKAPKVELSDIKPVAPKPWTQRAFRGECAYLVSKGIACCDPVGEGSPMASMYCPAHYEAMIDRPLMAKMTRRISSQNVEQQTKYFTRHERVKAATDTAVQITTAWDAGRS